MKIGTGGLAFCASRLEGIDAPDRSGSASPYRQWRVLRVHAGPRTADAEDRPPPACSSTCSSSLPALGREPGGRLAPELGVSVRAIRDVAQLGSAPALGAGDPGFKSPHPDHLGLITTSAHLGCSAGRGGIPGGACRRRTCKRVVGRQCRRVSRRDRPSAWAAGVLPGRRNVTLHQARLRHAGQVMRRSNGPGGSHIRAGTGSATGRALRLVKP